jgi:hypothetical protein
MEPVGSPPRFQLQLNQLPSRKYPPRCQRPISIRCRCSRYLLDHAKLKPAEGHGGAVTLIQRLGSAANPNVHLHCLVLDGVYRCSADGAAVFVEAGAPSDRSMRCLPHARRGRPKRCNAYVDTGYQCTPAPCAPQCAQGRSWRRRLHRSGL